MSVHDAGCSKAGQPHTGFESCCPGTTPTTDAREREARENVLETMWSGNQPMVEYYGEHDEVWKKHYARCKAENEVELDAYRAAILAAERARVRAVVLSQPEVFVPMSMRVGRNDERYIDGANLLARLDAEPTP